MDRTNSYGPDQGRPDQGRVLRSYSARHFLLPAFFGRRGVLVAFFVPFFEEDDSLAPPPCPRDAATMLL